MGKVSQMVNGIENRGMNPSLPISDERCFPSGAM